MVDLEILEPVKQDVEFESAEVMTDDDVRIVAEDEG
jgi:hypothetical protein